MYTTPNVPREKIPGIIFYMLISVVSLIANDFEYRLTLQCVTQVFSSYIKHEIVKLRGLYS